MSAASDRPRQGRDLRIVVMGVSGCGKTTLARALSERLRLDMVDGDDLHLPESIRKMSSGIALQDEDRWPWLDRIGEYLAASDGGSARGRVVACSALRRAYRDRIRAHAGDVAFVFLHGDAPTIHQRMAGRVGHYMQPGLLESQLRTLEVPGPDETDVLHLGIDPPVGTQVECTLRALALDAPASPSPA
ncbi:MAG: Thermoresistant gluconokinase [Pseudomonadota bacterium]|jgi:carbohydrate kinase (thermoresistant glucokinase family)